MQEQNEVNQDSVFKSASTVRSSQIFYNIADEDMTDFFMDYIQQAPQKQQMENNQQSENQKRQEEQQITENISDETQQIKLQIENKEIVSRLDIQIQKNGLSFVSVYGQLFIMLVKAQLMGERKSEEGKLLVTNYRLAFFKGRVRKLDLPFGFISQCKLNDRNAQIVAHLKYDHFWKLRIIEQKDFNHLKIFLQIYLKIQSIKSCFAFSYASKYPDLSKAKHPQIANEFARLDFSQFKQIHLIQNNDFSLCLTYPEFLYVPQKMPSKIIAKIGRFWHQSRFPVLAYVHSCNSKRLGAIWRCSPLVCQRTEDLKDVARYLRLIRENQERLTVFDAGYKATRKGLQQFEIDSACEMRYLQTDTIQSIKVSYTAIIQCFLNPKKTFIRDLLASNWYEEVLRYIKGAAQIANKVLSQSNIIIKCFDGKDKSSVFSALAQLIINPYYRTFKGFPVLVQKQFQFFGYPFTKRLGLSIQRDQQIPVFIMFLDCVCQLINTNQMCFQYNFKYLSKLSNLMYTCLFGTFITNCRKQSIQNHIQTETVPIWAELISQLTQNAFYHQKNGILQIPTKFDDIRIWKQHFWYLTTPPKETYRIHPLAEDNQDYIGLQCLKKMRENKNLQEEISKQKKILDDLKQKIKMKQEQKNV